MRTSSLAEKIKIKEIAEKYNMSVKEVETVVQSQYSFMHNKIKELKLEGIKTREEFDALKTNFNIPCIGKLYASWAIFKKINKIEED